MLRLTSIIHLSLISGCLKSFLILMYTTQNRLGGHEDTCN
jgi:hypothetical protein